MYHSEVDMTRNDEKDKALGSTEEHQYLGDLGIKLVLVTAIMDPGATCEKAAKK